MRTRPSFGMTTTQNNRDLFAFCSPCLYLLWSKSHRSCTSLHLLCMTHTHTYWGHTLLKGFTKGPREIVLSSTRIFWPYTTLIPFISLLKMSSMNPRGDLKMHTHWHDRELGVCIRCVLSNSLGVAETLTMPWIKQIRQLSWQTMDEASRQQLYPAGQRYKICVSAVLPLRKYLKSSA